MLYKIIFEMKNELNDLKHVVVDLMNGNSLSSAQKSDVAQRFADGGAVVPSHFQGAPQVSYSSNDDFTYHDPIEEHVEVEESLSLEEREKELIIKALDKHRGKRKYAAKELGISERTLYRKIKEYEIQK